MSENEKKETETAQDEFKGGTVMQCGATDYWAIGRTKDVRDEYPNLQLPHRLKALEVSFSYTTNPARP
jgi:hypothetical protein